MLVESLDQTPKLAAYQYSKVWRQHCRNDAGQGAEQPKAAAKAVVASTQCSGWSFTLGGVNSPAAAGSRSTESYRCAASIEAR